jgi:hypothetical protein
MTSPEWNYRTCNNIDVVNVADDEERMSITSPLADCSSSNICLTESFNNENTCGDDVNGASDNFHMDDYDDDLDGAVPCDPDEADLPEEEDDGKNYRDNYAGRSYGNYSMFAFALQIPPKTSERKAEDYARAIIQEHNGQIGAHRKAGILMVAENIAGKDFYICNATRSLTVGQTHCLQIWDGKQTDTPLISIPVREPFRATSLHPSTGKLIVKEACPQVIGWIAFFVFSTTTGEIVCSFQCPASGSEKVVLDAAGGRCLVTLDVEEWVVDTNTGRCLLTFNFVMCRFTLADEGFISCGTDGVTVWEISGMERKQISCSILSESQYCSALRCSWFGTLVAVSYRRCSIVWNYRTEETVFKIPRSADDAVFTCSHDVIIMHDNGHRIEIWNLLTRRQTYVLTDAVALDDRLQYVYSRNLLARSNLEDTEVLELWEIGPLKCVEWVRHTDLYSGFVYSEPVSLLL